MGDLESGATGKAKEESAALLSTGRLLPTSRKDLICLALLFVLSWYVRLLYQSESTTANPLRADAGKYARAAYNLQFYAAFSEAVPGEEPPQSRTNLPPGYPLFLTLFVSETDEPPGWEFALESIRHWQAAMGGVCTVLCYALARQGLPLAWSLFAGLLTCLSPHLVVISDYILTESLFQLLLLTGLLLLAIGWRRPRFGFLFFGFLLVAMSSQVRFVSLAMPLWLLPLFLYRADSAGRSESSVRVSAVAAMLAAILCVQSSSAVFKWQTVHNSPVNEELAGENARAFGKLKQMPETFRPPNFYVRGESHVLARTENEDWRYGTPLSFAEVPATYLRWNLYGKLLYSWQFDNAYVGDAYIYPMIRKGFEEHRLLKAIHRAMRALHWPLYVLALGGLVLLAYQSWAGALPQTVRMLWIPALALTYFQVALYFLSWLPRYSIPARSFSYVMAAYLLCYAAERWVRPQSTS